MTNIFGCAKIIAYKGFDEKLRKLFSSREMAVGASHYADICVCSFRAEKKKSEKRVELLRDCCVNVIGIV
ncbi:MAG: hypothetical protein IJV95_03090 [Clostridia bacterium]|nr:hypothetical protein [Clostridia bacterium]